MTDETVYVRRTTTSRTYHTDPDCRILAHARGEVHEWSLAKAERWDLSECGACAGVVDPTQQDRSAYETLRKLGGVSDR